MTPEHHRQSLLLGDHKQVVADCIDAWAEDRIIDRIWTKDHTVWSPDPDEVSNRLGWLDLPSTMRSQIPMLDDFAASVAADRIESVLLMGMGGSSLAPEVFAEVFGPQPGSPRLFVLDSTHPGAVASVEERIDLSTTLFIIASKSGTTLEPLSFMRYFWQRLTDAGIQPGPRFVAITDPGSKLEVLAGERGFRRTFPAIPDVGGRYSALTAFGLVPAAVIGIDVGALLDDAGDVARASIKLGGGNHALALGAVLGQMAEAGRDKATLFTSPSLNALPAWAEQLIAESTGKNGTGVIPVAGEPIGPPDRYGEDRLFIYLGLADDEDAAQRHAVDTLARAGHPVVLIEIDRLSGLAGEMFRAEFAVAVAGAVLGIQPFDQPDVELAKQLAKKAMDEPRTNKPEVAEVRAADRSELQTAIAAWVGAAHPGDYIGIQAYLNPDSATETALQSIRVGLRDSLGLATTVGFGPRFLHSTGQLHKGGPNTGLFLQLVDKPGDDLEVPETDFSFGRLIAAQALGDYRALSQRGRRILRVNLGSDVVGGLAEVSAALESQGPG